MPTDIYEFRDYHYAGDMDDYRRWWEEALPIFQQRFDVLGLWFDSGEPARIGGSSPMDLEHGSANVTWILRWPSVADRDRLWDDLWSDEHWLDCWSRHPGPDDYLQLSSRFLVAAHAAVGPTTGDPSEP